MTEPTGTMLSVRGSAERDVAPDYVHLFCQLRRTGGSKPEALSTAAAALQGLRGQLSELGGVALDERAGGSPLTFSARSTETYEEQEVRDKETGRYERTGRIVATVSVVITVRDFGLMDRLGTLLAGQEELETHSTVWSVDEDNPGWPVVRAEAIRAALRKGYDYAEALGGSLLRVEHIADAGLLGGDHHDSGHRKMPRLAATAGFDSDTGTPSLDPVPQTLSATIEARLVASGVRLPEGP